MATERELWEYAYNIYTHKPGYTLDKVLKLFPKYYAAIKAYYQQIEAENNRDLAIKFSMAIPVVVIVKFGAIANKIAKFHADRKEATDIKDMLNITLENIRFDKELLEDYEGLVKYYKLYDLDTKPLEKAINQQYIFLRDEANLYNALKSGDIDKVRSILTDGQ